MTRIISFIILLAFLTGDALAAFMDNVDEGIFEFRLDLRAPNYPDFTKISLAFSNYEGTKGFLLINDQTITSAGQKFVITDEDENFPAAVTLLTNGIPDYIAVMIANTPAYEVKQSNEPDLLFGDPSGDQGIDFAGNQIESIKLEITDMHFIYGFNPDWGPYTYISVQGEVTINAGSNHTPSTDKIPRYRLYNPNNYHHHYTTDANEYSVLETLGWIQEGTSCYLYNEIVTIDSEDAVPYLRLYNPNSYEHHWTRDANEYHVLGTIGWIQEGADGYVFATQVSGSEPLYRLYNPNDGLHHWTRDANERTVLVSYGFIDEGIACYVFP